MGLMVAVLALIIVVVAMVTLGFYLCWFYERRNFPDLSRFPDEGRLQLVPTVIGIVAEIASLSILVLSYPLRLFHDASPVRSRKPGEPPVILVHGYGGSSANFLLMQWRLKWRGWFNVYSVSYTPPHINARKLAQQVNDHVERILAKTGAEKAHLVCHSMGGPLTRYALKNLTLAGKVDKVITLGSPHYGSRVAGLVPALGAAAQMRYRSPFIQELAEGGECPGGARFFCIASNLDNFVLPVTSAFLPDAEVNCHIPYLGHCSLLYSTRVLNQVEAFLLALPPEDCLAEEQ